MRVTNDGTVPHSFALVHVPGDVDASLQELADGTRRFVFPTAAQGFDRPPEGRTVLAVDLAAGRYVFFCFTQDADGIPHARKGMASEFLVQLEEGARTVRTVR